MVYVSKGQLYLPILFTVTSFSCGSYFSQGNIFSLLLLFSHQLVSDFLWPPHGPLHARLPCPSPSPRVCPSSCSLNWWYYPTVSSSVTLFSLDLNLSQHQGFSSESAVDIKWQNVGASASASVLPMSIRGWFPLGLTGLISLLSKGLSRVFSSTTVQKCQFFSALSSLWSSSHIHTWLLYCTLLVSKRQESCTYLLFLLLIQD